MIYNNSYLKPIIMELKGKLENSAISHFSQFPFVYG